MTEQFHFHFSLSCTEEGNGNPLQSSCLENPRDREPGGLLSMGSHSRTRLKRLSSSSSSRELCVLIPLVYPARGYVSHTLSLPGEEQPEGKEVQTLGTHRDGVLT